MPPHVRARIPLIDQIKSSAVVGRTDHPSCRLRHFLQTWIQVGVFVTRPETRLQAIRHCVVDGVDLRQPQGRDECPDEPLPGQIDALCEGTSYYRKADAA